MTSRPSNAAAKSDGAPANDDGFKAGLKARVKARFDACFERFLNSKPMKMLAEGEMTPDDYREIMREVFHYARENPQLHTASALYLFGRDREMVNVLFKHAVGELGHEDLALNDFTTLGGDPTPVPYENPLPSTAALTSFAYYQIHRANPVGFIGYVYFLEFVATALGEKASGYLTNIGVGPGAMNFLRDHSEIDIAHNRIMELYLEGLVHSEAEFDALVFAMDTTGYLYAAMMEQATEYARAPWDRGWNWQELKADGKTPDDLRSRIGGKKLA